MNDAANENHDTMPNANDHHNCLATTGQKTKMIAHKQRWPLPNEDACPNNNEGPKMNTNELAPMNGHKQWWEEVRKASSPLAHFCPHSHH